MSAVTMAREGYTTMLDNLLSGLGAYAHLYTNAVTLTPDTTRADFTEPVMTGYAPQPVRLWTPPAMRGGLAFSVSDLVLFTYTTGPVPAPVRGVYVVAGLAGPLLWAWERLGGSFSFGPSSRVLSVYVTATWPLICP